MSYVRQTSRETYYEIEENGLLSEQRFRVYSALFRHGPCTAGELAKSMERDGSGLPGVGVTRNLVSRRLPELRDCGAACELGTRVCDAGGRNSIVWDVTANVPDQSLIRRNRPSKEIRDRAVFEGREAHTYWKKSGGSHLGALDEVLTWLSGMDR
jgi:hypothetical protein